MNTPEQNTSPPETSADVRIGRELVKATTPFAVESVGKSWWLTASTFMLLIGSMGGAAFAPYWALRLLFSLLTALALLMVRAFITYHDYMHGAILSRSRLAWLMFHVYAALGLTPARSWKKSHNYHHGHIGQISSRCRRLPDHDRPDVAAASTADRARYRLERHPLTVLTGYFTIFFLNICLLPLLRDPARHWDSAAVTARARWTDCRAVGVWRVRWPFSLCCCRCSLPRHSAAICFSPSTASSA